MLRPLISLVAYVALVAAFLFVPARTMHWRAAWVLLAVLLVVRGASTVRLWRVRRDLLIERTKPMIQRDQLAADRVLLMAFMAAYALLIAFASIDRWRLHLLHPIPAWLRVAGLMIFAAGWIVIHFALEANAFAVRVVRYQPDRGHTVADGGLYRTIRHPMYAGVILVMIGFSLWLGSAAALIGVFVPTAIAAIRIIHEERMLRTTLDGYAAYTTRVRWRLLPRVW